MEEDYDSKVTKENNIEVQIKEIGLRITEYQELIDILELKMQPLLLADELSEEKKSEEERAKSSPVIEKLYMKATILSTLNKRMRNIINRIDL